jgi:hypothetical protein
MHFTVVIGAHYVDFARRHRNSSEKIAGLAPREATLKSEGSA